MNEVLDNEKIIKSYNHFLKLNNNNTLGHNHNFYKVLKNENFDYDTFLKDKMCNKFQFSYAYDIHNNEYIKKYLFGDKTNNWRFREDKLKTIIACNIYHSRKLKGAPYKDFIINHYENIFKDFLTIYIDTNSKFIIDKTKMKLLHFDKAYNDAFETNNDKHRRFQKCKLKKQYQKYLECEDIAQCELKEQLYLIIALVNIYIRHEL